MQQGAAPPLALTYTAPHEQTQQAALTDTAEVQSSNDAAVDEIDDMLLKCKDGVQKASPRGALKRPASKGKASNVVKVAKKRPMCPADVGEKAEAFEYCNCKVYTSLARNAWRVLPKGEKVDRAFKWTDAPETAWCEAMSYCETFGSS